jgi:hypothetical protein
VFSFPPNHRLCISSHFGYRPPPCQAMIPPWDSLHSLMHSLATSLFLGFSCMFSPRTLSFLGLLLPFLPLVRPLHVIPLGRFLTCPFFSSVRRNFVGQSGLQNWYLVVPLAGNLCYPSQISIPAFIEGGGLFNYQPLPINRLASTAS